MTETKSAMPAVVQQAINYKKIETVPSKYKLFKVPLRNTPNLFSVGNASTTQVEFLMPSGSVYNFAKSYLSYELIVPGLPAHYNFTFQDVSSVTQNVYFGNNSSLSLMDLQYANNWSKLNRPMNTKPEELMNKTPLDGFYPALRNTGRAVVNNPLAFPYFVPNAPAGYTNLGNIWGQGAGLQTNTADITPLDWQHIKVGRPGEEIRDFRNVQLGDLFHNTLLGMDKDLFFGNVDMFLRLTLATGQKVAWRGSDPLNPFTGAIEIAAGIPEGAAGAVAAPGYWIRNLTLWLAIEQNEVIADSVRAKFNSPGGITMQMPYVVAQRTSSGSTAANFQYTFSASNGKKLRSILWSAWNNDEKFAKAYDCHNWAGDRIQSYNTFLDSNPLQQYPVECSQSTAAAFTSDDWLINKGFLKNTCYFNQGIYQLLWHHQDRFSERPEDSELEDNINDGLSLGNTAHLWSVQAKTTYNRIIPANNLLADGKAGAAVAVGDARSLVHYIYFTYLRDVSISANTIEIV